MAIVALAAACGVGAAPSLAGGPKDVPVAAVGREPGFMLKSISSPYVVVHVLADADSKEGVEFVKTVLARQDERAGLTHVFVRGGTDDQLKSWWAMFAPTRAIGARDVDGALAKELNVPGTTPVTVILDGAGGELTRIVGASGADYPTIDALYAAVDRATRPRAIDEYNLPKGSTLALNGYDVVSYFADQKASPGSKEIVSKFQGVTYRFATAAHRASFAAEPIKYLPTYGGWCASAMGAKGEKVEIDPTNYKIKDGRLHLFYKSIWGDALKDWNKNEKAWEPAADVSWKKIAGEDGGRPK